MIFLCGLVFLTVVAVLFANIGFENPTETTKFFAKWGTGVVLAEIIGLFAIATRWVFSERISTYSLVIGPLEDIEVDIARISWDMGGCFLHVSEDKWPIKPVRSKVGRAFEIKLPYSLFEKVDEQTPIEISLRDKFGCDWEVESFYLYQKEVTLRALSPPHKILAAYGPSDE